MARLEDDLVVDEEKFASAAADMERLKTRTNELKDKLEKMYDDLANAMDTPSVDFRELRKTKNKDLLAMFIVELHLAFSFVGMLFALLLMYKLTEGSKHLLTFMAVGVFIISMMKTKFYKKPAFIGLVFAYFYIVMALDPYDYQVPFAEAERVAQVEQWQEIYAENLEMTDQDVPNYENAIIWVFSDTVNGESNETADTDGVPQVINTKWQLYYGLPEGFGISCCMPDYVLEHLDELQCRYLGTVAGGEIDERCAQSGWVEIGRDRDLVVYEKNQI